ncbi:GH92 family glycosyl hydrolase [Schumannella soli]|uniref:Glycoside hydrolase family 92 protein n=1 Tax=Schumannella soli TaxID=2590779 RepID=A0A506Y201_9MICO|nr:GH92 family glycosyl hydrolase [Schumannella soli]TPW75477.1 glycoside hydrolase family 92 protein [Schumannella soli]
MEQVVQASTPSSPTTRVARTALAGGVALALAAAGVLVGTAPASAATPLTTDPAATVDPFIGSANAGNTFPGAVAPFGMLAWSPDQSTKRSDGTMRTPSPSGYEYGANTVRGFSLTHVSGAGCAGLSGDIPFLPITQQVTTSPSAADAAGTPMTTTFSHARESASPGSYSVDLDNGVGVKLAATTRTGSGTFNYPKGSPATMLVRTSDSLVGSSDADIQIDAKHRRITGSVTSGNFCGGFTGDGILQKSYYTVHFVAEFDTDFTTTGTWQDAALTPGATSAEGGTTYPGGYPPAGKGSGGYVSFDTAKSRTVNMRVGISYVDLAGAKKNLATENPVGTTRAQVAKQTKTAWNTELNRIRTGGGTAAERTTFYTALYHSLLHPSIANDVTGRYTGMDLATHKLTKGQQAQYQTFSGWDVYRSQVQLVTLLDAKRGSDVAQSLKNQADQNGGVWDRWTHNSGTTHVMVGDPSAAALAGIVAFGGTDFDLKGSYASLAQAARVPTKDDLSRAGWNIAVVGQRPSLDQFLKYGYYPEGCNAWGCPNETLEMGAADAGLAQLAQHLGLTKDYTEFTTRSQSWQNQFNPQATDHGGYIQGRNADGSWKSGFDPASSDGFVEGTAAQYTWMVQHDPAGLFAAMGGNEAAAQRLDGFFREVGDENDNGVPNEWTLAGGSWDTNLHANVDNEPSIGTPWLYDYAGQPWKTQQTVRETIRQLWIDTKDGQPNGPDGIPGNDDLGQMSSWLVFAAMGIYPQNPSRAELATATPLFPEIVLHRANGPVLHLSSPGAGLDKPYIQTMKVDGKKTSKVYLDAAAITRDTQVDYTLSATPNTTRGTAAADAPPSVRDGERSHLASIVPSNLSAAPGGTTDPVKVHVQRIDQSDSSPVTWGIAGAEGISASPASGTIALDVTGAGDAAVTLRAAADTAVGDHTVTVTVKAGTQTLATQKVTVTVAAQVSDLAGSGFETGQPQAPASQVVANDGVGGYCCGLTGPESKVQTGDPHTGIASVVYSGRGTKEGATASNLLLDLSASKTAVQKGDTLSYWVRPQQDGGPFSDYVQDASADVAVDVRFTDGTLLSAEAPTASNGAALTAAAQGKALKVDTWNRVTAELPDSVVGKTVDALLLSFAPHSHGGDADKVGYLRGWVDDVALQRPVPPVTATPSTGLAATAGAVFEGVLATVAHGDATAASSYTATIDWGDGSKPVAGTVAPLGVGSDGAPTYGVSGSHTFAKPGVATATITVEDADGVRTTASVPISVSAPAAARATTRAGTQG